MGIPTTSLLGQGERQVRYNVRLKRFLTLLELDAPAQVVANEAILIATAVYSKDMSVNGLARAILEEDYIKEINAQIQAELDKQETQDMNRDAPM